MNSQHQGITVQTDGTQYRHEKKYVWENQDFNRLKHLLKLHPAIFRPIFTPRTIYNLYFDDLDLSFYHDNIGGAPNRVKVRLRWYGALHAAHRSRSIPELEIKIKQGEMVRKSFVPAAALPESVLANLPKEILSYLDLGRPAKDPLPDLHTITQKLPLLQPSLYNSYQRQYLISGDGKVRATIDSGLTFSAVSTKRLDQHFSIRPKMTILELKSDAHHLEEITAVAKHLPFFRQRLSKYALGVSSLEQHDY